MSDPLSGAGTAVGVIWLGITAIQGLVDYYSAFRSQDDDVAITSRKLTRQIDLLESSLKDFEQRQFQIGDRKLITAFEECMKDCNEITSELRNELSKLAPVKQASLRSNLRRAAYPFRQSTLRKLEESVEDFMSCISFARQIIHQHDIQRVHSDLDDTKELVSLMRASQLASESALWLRAPDATANLNEAIAKKHPGTGQWLVRGPEFTTWLQKPQSFMWLTGFAGCGKSVLCSTAIQQTFLHRQGDREAAIAFFFFTFNDAGKQDAGAMLRALIIQLYSQLDDGHLALTRLKSAYGNALPPNSALIDCLHQIVRGFRDVYILLDALDESPVDMHREYMLDVLGELRQWPNVRILAASRDEIDIRERICDGNCQVVRMRGEGMDLDIESFISQHLRTNRRLQKWVDHHSRIEQVLTAKAQGVFRWVECQFKALARCPASEYHLENLLNTLPQTLDETYERMLCNIPRELRNEAKMILVLLCRATRPLTVAEICDGLAVELGDKPRFNPKRRLKDQESLDELCPGFTESEHNDDVSATTIRIAHFSVQEYLESERISQSTHIADFHIIRKVAEAEVAIICLTIILEAAKFPAAVVAKQYDPTVSIGQYAARHWPAHYSQCAKTEQVHRQVDELFSMKTEHFTSWVKIWNIDDEKEGRSWYRRPTRLYSAALLGLDRVLANHLNPRRVGCTVVASETLKPEENVNLVGGIRGNAMQAAAANGFTDIVKRLLQHGAHVNATGGTRGTALQQASVAGHTNILVLLLDLGADVNAADETNCSALQNAASRGDAHVVQLLLKYGADALSGHHMYGTALHGAADYGKLDIVKMLLEKGANPNKDSSFLGTPLQLAAFRGHKQVVEYLLQQGADPNFGNAFNDSALQAASQRGHSAIVEILLQANASLNSSSGWGTGTALAEASGKGYADIVSMLLAKGADVNEGGNARNPLQLASSEGQTDIVCQLLDAGADVNATNKHYGTALCNASAKGCTEIMEKLLTCGADPNLCSEKAMGALQAAASHGHIKAVELLVRSGADLQTSSGGCEKTPLQLASENGSLKAVDCFLAAGADVNAAGRYGTALHLASAAGYPEVVELLLNKGANINAQCDRAGTALYNAAINGQMAILEMLIVRGADINLVGLRGTALQAALSQAHVDVAKRLLEAGADFCSEGGTHGSALSTACRYGHADVVDILLGKGANINAADAECPLKNAICGGHELIVQRLLHQGAEINNVNTVPVLQLALREGHRNIARLLLDSGANVNTKAQIFIAVDTPLTIAASKGYSDIVDALIEKGARINEESRNPNERCALGEATRNGHTEIVRRLLRGGAEVNAGHDIPLLLASSNGSNDIVKLLIQAGADVNVASPDVPGLYRGDGNAIQLAAANGHLGTVALLLQHGAHIHSTIGDSALQRALEDKHEKVVRLLLQNGADMATLSGDVNTVLRLACHGGHDDIVDYAIQNGADVNALGDPSGSPVQAASANGHMSVLKRLLELGAHVNNTGRYWSALQQASDGGHTNAVKLLLDNGALFNTKAEQCDRCGDN